MHTQLKRTWPVERQLHQLALQGSSTRCAGAGGFRCLSHLLLPLSQALQEAGNAAGAAGLHGARLLLLSLHQLLPQHYGWHISCALPAAIFSYHEVKLVAASYPDAAEGEGRHRGGRASACCCCCAANWQRWAQTR